MNRSKLIERIGKCLETGCTNNVIREILIHPNPHWDERLATFILREYGSDILPGIESAIINDWDANGTDFWTALSKGSLLVGQGEGPLDEHRDGSRIENMSAAKLAAILVRPPKSQVVLDLVRETTREDSTGRSNHRLNLAHLVKLMNRLSQYCNVDIHGWARVAISAHLDYPHKGRPSVSVSKKLMNSLVSELLLRLDVGDHETEINNIIHNTVNLYSSSTKPFCLAHVAHLISRSQDDKVAFDWVVSALEVEVLRQIYFKQALHHFRGELPGYVTVPVKDGCQPVTDEDGNILRIAILQFENPEGVRAAMSKCGLHAAVVVNREPSGHTQILFNRQYTWQDAYRRLKNMLFMIERDRWYFPFPGGALNGSESHREVIPSSIKLADVARVVNAAFTN